MSGQETRRLEQGGGSRSTGSSEGSSTSWISIRRRVSLNRPSARRAWFKLRHYRLPIGLALVTRIADLADEQNHRDVTIHWNVARLTLWTPAWGGITDGDFPLAESIELILSSPRG
ncbi:MAG TPA: 4a-hydroxytetrahydrobiopterin dehydratase [Candidatus Limnocylindrales bacterium]